MLGMELAERVGERSLELRPRGRREAERSAGNADDFLALRNGRNDSGSKRAIARKCIEVKEKWCTREQRNERGLGVRYCVCVKLGNALRRPSSARGSAQIEE